MVTFGRLFGSNDLNISSLVTHLPSFGNPNGFVSQRHSILEQLKDHIPSLLFGFSSTQTIVLILCIAWALEPLLEKRPAVTNAVYHGYLSWLEPTLFLRARFIFNARALIASGSLQVCPAAFHVTQR
jgi:hypothetical protein